MKRICFLLLCTILPLLNFAQQPSRLRWGIKGGGNLSQITIDNEIKSGNDDASYKLGFYVGGIMEIPVSDRFKGQIEVLYNRHNFKNIYNSKGAYSSLTKFHLTQISMPFQVKYFIIPLLSINAGFSISYNSGGKGTGELIDFDPFFINEFKIQKIEGYQKFQVGAFAGVTCHFYKGLFIDGRYNRYLGNLVNGNEKQMFDYKNMNAFQLGLGYLFSH